MNLAGTDASTMGRLAALPTAAIVVLSGTVLLATVPALRSMFGLGSESRVYVPGGSILDVVPAALISEPRNLVVFARHDCAACQESWPALLDLLVEAKREGANVVLVVPDPGRAEDVAFAKRLGLSESSVVSRDLSRTPVQHVPAIAVVDGGGKILLFREGLLSEEYLGEAVRALGQPASH